MEPPEPEDDDDFNGGAEMVDYDEDSQEGDAAPSVDRSLDPMLTSRDLLSTDRSSQPELSSDDIEMANL